MKPLAMLVLFCVMSAFVFLGLGSCGGDDDESCPGIVCHDCGGSGDCEITCAADQVEYCGNFGFFADEDLRCAFCDDPDAEF